MRRFRGLFFCNLTLVLCAAAQSPLGTVTGLAVDPSGAAVAGATITVRNLATGVVQKTKTNSGGNYVAPNLPQGEYSLSAEAQGFARLEVNAFSVASYQTVRQDLVFKLAATAAEVTVLESASPVIQLESPSVSSQLSARQIQQLPSNLRSVYNNAGDSGLIANLMPLTVPGVVQMGSGAYWMSPGAGPNGLRTKVDGIDTTFGNFGSADVVSQPSMESVAEFSANLAGNRAEFSGLGAVTTVTKAGGNDLHAGLFWIARNSALDARNAFQNQKPFQNLHNLGGTLSGAVAKDKTFFHSAYEHYRGVRAYLFNANVPTLAWRGGDFGSAVVRDPYAGNQPFPSNRIPSSRVTTEAGRAQDLLFPLPNFGDSALTAGNYRASFTGPEAHSIAEMRLDHHFSPVHTIFGRYQYKHDDYDIPGAREPLPPTTAGTSSNIREMQFFTFGSTWTARPTIYNEFRSGLVLLSSASQADVQGQPLLDQIGVRGLTPRPGAPGVPTFNISGLSRFNQRLLNPVYDSHFQVSDNLTWLKGKHTVKGGVEYVRWFVNRFQPAVSGLYGSFTFQNRFTSQPYGDFLLGLPTQVTRIDPSAPQYFRWNDLSFFLQDDWKVSRRLSVNFGMRYEFNQPASTRDGNIYSFDMSNGAVVLATDAARAFVSAAFPSNLPTSVAGAGLGSSLRRADMNNWAPRAGFSLQLDDAAKTVLRGGAGVYYGHYSVAAVSSLTSGPFAVSTTSNNAFVAGQPLFTLAQPFAVPGSAGTLNLNGVVPDLLNMMAMQWNLTLERELRRNLGVRLSYIGTKGSQLAYQRNINQPLPSVDAFAQSRRPWAQYNNIIYADNGANNSYQGLQLGVTKRFASGLGFMSTWVWAKSLSEVDDTDNAEIFTRIENTYDRSRDRADSYAVPRHQWMNNVIYDLPFGRGLLLGGWQLSALFNLQTGHWLNPQFTGSDPSNTNNFGGRPDRTGALTYPQTLSAWFSPQAFSVPERGRFGNAARNSVQGPGFVVFNLGASKSMRFESAGEFQLSASFQNVLNHNNWGQPNMTANVAQAGTITSSHVFLPAGSARTAQFGLRWSQ